MKYRRSQGGILEIGPDTLATIQSYRQTGLKSEEAGGMLLGRLILNSCDVVLDEATSPSPKDRRSRFRFWRAKAPAQHRVRQAWKESNGTRVYLGEWHTHPEDVPSGPSQIDMTDWVRLLKRTRIEHDFLIFIIVGRTAIRIWEAPLDKGTITEIFKC